MEKKLATLLLSAIGIVSFARAGDGIDHLLQQKFEAKFGKTTLVKWKKFHDVFIGQFVLNNESMECYFSDLGELLGTGRYFTSDKIDQKTRAAINSKFPGWFIQQSYEYTASNESPRSMFILSDIKHTAIVSVNGAGAIEVIEENKNKLHGNLQKPEFPKNTHLKIQSIM